MSTKKKLSIIGEGMKQNWGRNENKLGKERNCIQQNHKCILMMSAVIIDFLFIFGSGLQS
jgi:hypothetical protein